MNSPCTCVVLTISATLLCPGPALADASPVASSSEDILDTVIVTAGRETRSTVTLAVSSTFMLGAQLSYTVDRSSDAGALKRLKSSLNGTNLADRKGVSTAVVTGASGGYQAFPVPPSMAFATVEAGF